MDCSLGHVVDLSGTGMRVLARRRLAGSKTLTITGPDGKLLKLRARVVWHRRHAAGEHIHGLQFERVTLEQRDRLHALLELIAKGRAVPAAVSLRQYGLSGAVMACFAFVMLGGWFAWTWQQSAIQSKLPELYETLSRIPELGAILLISGCGCALLGLTQRLFTKNTNAASQEVEPVFFPQASTNGIIPGLSEIERMKRSQSVLNCILESSLGGVCVLETVRDENREIKDFQIQLINPSGEQLIGIPEHQLVGKTLTESLPGLMQHEIYKDLIEIVQDGRPIQREYKIGADGKWYLVAMVQLADGIAITFMDNTESQLHREKLQHIAYHDELTGLPNRKALMEHVDSAITRSQRSAGHRSALLFLDFDRFKHVNDTLGHEAGDQLLIGIARRLDENLRDTDTFSSGTGDHLPARLGGDEFVVLLEGIKTTDDAVTVAKRLLSVFNQPHNISGQQIVSTASIGIAFNDGKYNTAEEILRDADAAMYIAKQTGKGRYVLFDYDMQQQVIHRLNMEKHLRHAIERDQLSLVYEPIVDLESGQVAGFEALVRWNHPEFGAVSPADFIPLAEELNLIGKIGEWVVQQGCAQLADWHHSTQARPFLNVNLSRGQLYEPNLVSFFEDQIKLHNLNPSDLRLELTETMVMNDLDFMAEKLSQIKDLGIGLALDDFGTGYSSLSVLHKLPFDTLKIDRAFLEQARFSQTKGQSIRSAAIIAAITNLAEQLDLEVVAEGITEFEQVVTLQALACRYAQGRHFSYPLSDAQATQRLVDPAAYSFSVTAQLNASA